MKLPKEFPPYQSLIILGLVACMVPYLFGKYISLQKDFNNELWVPAYHLMHGESPYNRGNMAAYLPAIWLPMGISLFSPLGMLPESTATYIWFIFNIVEVVVMLFLAMGMPKSPWTAGMVALLAFFFPPLINHFELGQFSITTMLCMILAAYFIEHKNETLASFFAAIGMTKPQLALIGILGLCFHYFHQHNFRGWISFCTKITGWIALLCVPLFVIYPMWIKDLVANFQANPLWIQPSLFSILPQEMGILGLVVWGCIATASITTCFFVWEKRPPENAMYWTLGLTTISSIYLWSWDFILLLPLWTSIFSKASIKKRIFFFSAYLLAWIAMVIIQRNPNGNNQWFWWVPIWFMGIILLITLPTIKFKFSKA
jgi:hypothetical protein